MQNFHIVIRALPSTEMPKRKLAFAGIEVEAMTVPPAFQATPLRVSFEEAAAAFETFPRMFIEPDGSFVWVSPADAETAWQVDGNLYDRDGSLIAVDLKGTCQRTPLSQLLDVFRARGSELMIEAVREGVFLRERDFLESLSSG